MSGFSVPHLGRPVAAIVNVPGSKSLANRALVAASLGAGDSVLSGVPAGDDTMALIAALDRLGVVIERGDDQVLVHGTRGQFTAGPIALHAGLAGTTSRFLTALACLAPGPVVIDGDPPLRRRPMAPLHVALRALGARVEWSEAEGALPVTVTGPIRSGRVTVPGDISSQYLTALMLIGPMLPSGLEVMIDGPLVSRPYVEMTATVMRVFGVPDVVVEPERLVVGAGGYGAADYVIEPDASSASYPLALAAVCGGEVTVEGLGFGSVQGDASFAAVLERMGCEVDRSETSTTVRRAPGAPLVGIDVDMSDISDLVPTMAMVAAVASTPTRIRGVGFIRAKESDRLGDLAAELRRVGADVQVHTDGLGIRPAPLHGARLGTHHDHRLAMAFGVLGAVVPGIELDEPAVVSKSWPSFWDDLSVIER